MSERDGRDGGSRRNHLHVVPQPEPCEQAIEGCKSPLVEYGAFKVRLGLTAFTTMSLPRLVERALEDGIEGACMVHESDDCVLATLGVGTTGDDAYRAYLDLAIAFPNQTKLIGVATLQAMERSAYPDPNSPRQLRRIK